MSFEKFRQQVSYEVFDYQMLVSNFSYLKKPRDKISSLIADGKIVRIKKGLYVFGEDWRRGLLSLEMISSLIYGPSCISFEYALSHYGLMAERSSVVTCLAIGDSKTFHTPIGEFEYRAIDREKFKIGIDYKDLGKEGGYFIASREKALVDLIYRTPGIKSLEQLRYFLFEEMRIDEGMFREFDFSKLEEISKVYKKKSVNMLVKL